MMAITLQQLQSIATKSGDMGWAQVKNIMSGLSATVQNIDPSASYLLYNGYTTVDNSGTNMK
jgi:hypothetical protein